MQIRNIRPSAGFFEKARKFENSYIIRCRTCEQLYIYEVIPTNDRYKYVNLKCGFCGTVLCEVNASSTRVLEELG